MPAMRALFLAALLYSACPAPTASAQAAESADPSPFARAMDLAGEGKMMPAVALLDAAYEAGEFDAHSLAQFHSLVGDEAGALALFDSDAEPGDGAVDLSGYSAVPAIEAILEAAKDRRVVMINEAHHVSRHRAFGHLLMAELRKVGFTHLAAETFCNGCDSLTQDGAPVRTTGFYTRDPVYGDFVRQALSLGYGLVPYEQTPQQNSAFDQPSNVFIALREHAQAANLKAFLDANPDARLLVFVGHGHHAEMGMGEEGEDLLMGARFARMSGIDPLTINQEFGTPRSSPQFDAPIYRGARAIAGSPEQPFVVRGEDGSMVADAGFDVTLFHPRDRKSVV